MPTIPVLSNTTVRATPEQSRLRPLEAYGADTRATQAVAGALGNVAGIVERERARMDEVRTNEAEVEYARAIDAAWADPSSGLMHQRGRNAIEGLDPFNDRLRTSLSEVEATLSTDRQRALFQARAIKLANDAQARAKAHVGSEIRRSDEMTFDALNARDVNDIAVTAGDVARVTETLRGMNHRITQFGDRNGWTPEAVEQARAKATSAGRLRQVTALTDAESPDVEAARSVIEAHGDQFSADDREKATRSVQGADLRKRGQEAEDRIMAAHGDDEAAALAAARKEPSAIRDDAVSRVKARFAEKDRIRADEDSALVDREMERLERTGRITKDSGWDEAARVKGLRGALEAREAQLQSGRKPETNWDVYDRFMLSSEEELAAMNPATLRPYLSESLYKQAVDIIAEARGTGGKGTLLRAEVGRRDDLVRQMGEQAGLIERDRTTGTFKGDNAAELDHLTIRAGNAIEAKATELNRPLTPPEQTAAIREAMDWEILTASASSRDKGQYGQSVAPLTTPRALAIPPSSEELRLARRARWNELVNAGILPDVATARVMKELPE